MGLAGWLVGWARISWLILDARPIGDWFMVSGRVFRLVVVEKPWLLGLQLCIIVDLTCWNSWTESTTLRMQSSANQVWLLKPSWIPGVPVLFLLLMNQAPWHLLRDCYHIRPNASVLAVQKFRHETSRRALQTFLVSCCFSGLSLSSNCVLNQWSVPRLLNHFILGPLSAFPVVFWLGNIPTFGNVCGCPISNISV